MVKSVSGIGPGQAITATTPAAPITNQPRFKLDTLQHNDVFFSDSSPRARMHQFLNNPKKPLMFSFRHPGSVFDTLLPKTRQQRTVLMMVPVMQTPGDKA